MNEEFSNNLKMYIKNAKNTSYLSYIKHISSQYHYRCIFGMGNVGKELHDELLKREVHVDFFCDNNIEKVGTTYKNTKCISLNDLSDIRNETLILISTVHYKEIYKQLTNLGFSNIERLFSNKLVIEDEFLSKNEDEIYEKINSLLDILADDLSRKVILRIVEEWGKNEYSFGQIDDIYSENQYFTKELVELSKEEIFVDAGAYIGDTIEEFLKKTNYQFETLYSFELNKDIFAVLKENVNKYDEDVNRKINLYNVGLSDKNHTCSYSNMGAGSSIDFQGEHTAEINRLDDILEMKRVTFIKMDIEGSELNALKGANCIINRWRPKLAISIYHKMEDIWEIPIFLNDLNLGYKLYVRHHTDCLNETVCYAL